MVFLKKLFPLDALKETVLRFPASAVCSFALFALYFLSIHNFINLDKAVMGRIILLLVCGFFWFGFARLAREGMAWAHRRAESLDVIGFLVLGALVFFNSGFSLVWLLVLTVPALLLGISVAPYLKSSDSLSFWFYNRQVWLGAALSVLAGIIWAAGISAALGAIDYLFGVDVDRKIYSDIWSFAVIVFGPLYALSWVPTQFSYKEEDCHAPAQLAFMINWVLAPLVVVYMLILYAYFIKIAAVGELPRGQLAYMITAFGGVGVLTYLAGWPLRESGGPFLKPIYKVFFPALIIPVVMQAVSIYMRIDQYGVTEQRYIVALSTVWFAMLAVGFTFRNPALKCITGVLAVMLLLAAFGPLSAPNVAERSQMGRLEILLNENAILVDGVIVKTEKDVSFDDRKGISSILDFLQQRKKMDRLEKWLPDLKEGRAVPNASKLTEQMGFEYVNRYERKQTRRSENVNLNSNFHKGYHNVQGYKVLTKSQYVNAHQKKRQDNETRIWESGVKNNEGVLVYYEDDKLCFDVKGRGVVCFDVAAFALEEFKRDPSNKRRDMTMEEALGDVRVKVMFQNISLRREIGDDGEEHPLYLNTFNFQALVDY